MQIPEETKKLEGNESILAALALTPPTHRICTGYYPDGYDSYPQGDTYVHEVAFTPCEAYGTRFCFQCGEWLCSRCNEDCVCADWQGKVINGGDHNGIRIYDDTRSEYYQLRTAVL